MKAPNSEAADRARITKQYADMQKTQALLQIPILESMGYVVTLPDTLVPELG